MILYGHQTRWHFPKRDSVNENARFLPSLNTISYQCSPSIIMQDFNDVVAKRRARFAKCRDTFWCVLSFLCPVRNMLGNGWNTVYCFGRENSLSSAPNSVSVSSTKKTRWVCFDTPVIGWEELAEFSPWSSREPKDSLSSVFELERPCASQEGASMLLRREGGFF